MGDLYKVDFKKRIVRSKNNKPTGLRLRTSTGRKISKGVRAVGGMSAHEKIFHGATIAGAGIDYFHNRHEGLNKRQSAAVSGLGAGLMLASHHAARQAHVGWKTGLAVDVASSVAGGYAQDRLRKHYQAKNRSVSVGRSRGHGRF